MSMNESNQIGIPNPAQTMGGNPSSLVEFNSLECLLQYSIKISRDCTLVLIQK
jgi:hypothetical protein